jgi:hypothetical protein
MPSRPAACLPAYSQDALWEPASLGLSRDGGRYSLLRVIEQNFGLPLLGDAGDNVQVLAADPTQCLLTCTAEPGSPSQDAVYGVNEAWSQTGSQRPPAQAMPGDIQRRSWLVDGSPGDVQPCPATGAFLSYKQGVTGSKSVAPTSQTPSVIMV